jgi:hypothetical protein
VIDPLITRNALQKQIRAIFEAAAQNRLDIRIAVEEPNSASDWTPSKPLSLSDFKPAALTSAVTQNRPMVVT